MSHVHALGFGMDPEHYRLSFEEGQACTEKAKVLLVCPNDQVDDVVTLIQRNGRTGHRGDGVVFVSDVERIIKIRTGDEDALALMAIAIAWAFWRVRAKRVDAHRAAERSLAAEELLRNRFSCGEIDEQEFLERMAALRASREA